jgi:hypothetical protein
MRKVVSFSLPQNDQMNRLVDAVCPPGEKGNFLQWSFNDETGELDLYEEDYE